MTQCQSRRVRWMLILGKCLISWLKEVAFESWIPPSFRSTSSLWSLCNVLRFAADFVVLEAVAAVQSDWYYEVSCLILPMQGFCHSLGFRSILVMGWTKMISAGCLVEMCEARSLSCSFPCSCSCSGSGRRLSLRNEFPGSFLDSNAGSSQVTLRNF